MCFLRLERRPYWLTDRIGRPQFLRQYCPRWLFSSTFLLLFTHITAGQTPLGAKLRQILDIYVPRIEEPSYNHKPISILVITDGQTPRAGVRAPGVFLCMWQQC